MKTAMALRQAQSLPRARRGDDSQIQYRSARPSPPLYSPPEGGKDKEGEGIRDGLPFILCRDLFKIYKRADLEVVALRGLNLTIEQGELVAIVGASGSGKSTLLNILAGLDRPSAGQVRVGQRDLLDISEQGLVAYRRQDVGFVWQATARNLLPYLSVADNIELPMALAGQPGSHRRGWAMTLLEALGIGDKAERMPHQLSGGEQQRAAIGVALANQPPLLLADEPTGELDTANAVLVFELLKSLNRNFGVTIIIVTHYPAVSQFVDRVVHIRDGRIGSETISTASYRPDGARAEYEFLVVDEAGRLQLPEEYAERFRRPRIGTGGGIAGRAGLARIGLEDGRVTLLPSDDYPANHPLPAEREFNSSPLPPGEG